MFDLETERFDFDHDGAGYRQATFAFLKATALPDGVILSVLKARLKARIDGRAEEIRSAVATPGAGQAMEYQEAQSQAAAALKASSSATPEKYPMLAASIGIDADPTTGAPATDVVGVARAVTAAYQAWQAIGSEIRRVRLTGKAAVDAATTSQDAVSAYDAIAWPGLPS